MIQEHDWETISEHNPNERMASSAVERTPIPGGWLVRYTHYDYHGNLHAIGGITFVPDPGHFWEGGPYCRPLSKDEIADLTGI